MVHDAADVPAGPGNLDPVRVAFDEQRLISDAGLLVTATLAERLGIEELVNESVWLDPEAAGRVIAGAQGDVVGARDARRRRSDRSDELSASRLERPDPGTPSDGALDIGHVPARPVSDVGAKLCCKRIPYGDGGLPTRAVAGVGWPPGRRAEHSRGLS